jgi:hypothetical protein
MIFCVPQNKQRSPSTAPFWYSMSTFSFLPFYSPYLCPIPAALWLPIGRAWVRSASEHLWGGQAARLLRWLLLMRDAAAGGEGVGFCGLRRGAGAHAIRRRVGHVPARLFLSPNRAVSHTYRMTISSSLEAPRDRDDQPRHIAAPTLGARGPGRAGSWGEPLPRPVQHCDIR